MSDQQTADATETPEQTPDTEQTPDDFKAEAEKWKALARKHEEKAKANAEAAKRLGEIEDAQKSEAEKAAERIAKAEAEIASVPAKVADALRAHLVALHEIDEDDAELFLTATEPELLLKQVARLVSQSDKRKNHIVPREGATPQPKADERAAFADFLTGRHQG